MKQDQTALKLSEYLEKYRGFYHNMIKECQRRTDLYSNCVFAILSVHTQFPITKDHYLKDQAGTLDWYSIWLSRIKRMNLSKLNHANHVGPLNAETLAEHKFLGPSKRFFGLAFKDPEYFCLDTWIIRGYFKMEKRPGVRDYRAMEKHIRTKAERLKWAPFALQWAIWEYLQKQGHIDHTFLFNPEVTHDK